jgi:hypothetical protein
MHVLLAGTEDQSLVAQTAVGHTQDAGPTRGRDLDAVVPVEDSGVVQEDAARTNDLHGV